MSRYQNPLEIIGLARAVALGTVCLLCTFCNSNSPHCMGLCATNQGVEISAGVWLDVEGEVSEAASTGSVASYADAPAVGTLGFAAPQCTVTRSPASPPDADADGVPDSVSLALNTCVLTYAPQETDTLLGTIVIKDPTPTTLDHNVQRTYQQVEFVLWAPEELHLRIAHHSFRLVEGAQGVHTPCEHIGPPG
jgi:hypothetical protein